MRSKSLSKQAGMAVAAAAFAVTAKAARALDESARAPGGGESRRPVRATAPPRAPIPPVSTQPRRFPVRLAAGTIILVLLSLVAAFAILARPAAKANADAASGRLAVTFDGSRMYEQTAPATELQPDPEAKFSHPESRSAARRHRVATMPAASTTAHPRAGLASSSALRRQLREARAAVGGGGVTLMSDGSAVADLDAPDEIQQVVAAANVIRDFPYIWGGGHGSFQDNGYDCSGSVSYALAGANLVSRPLVSGQFTEWGEPGPGKWLTVYANAGHMFMVVGGLRYDTSFRDGPRGSRWQDAPRKMKGFAVRHWPGL